MQLDKWKSSFSRRMPKNVFLLKKKITRNFDICHRIDDLRTSTYAASQAI
jgi:hypothetical protein